jgi:predicted ABC-type ATPase
MPSLTVVAGPNGSGKSTLIKYLQRQGISLGNYVNADDIAKYLGLTGEQGSLLAQRIADEARDYHLKSGHDFSFETVMSHESKTQFMARARGAGHFVTLYFVCTDSPLKNVERVKFRVAHGGHDVPVDRIIARYHRTLHLLPEAIRNSDKAVLFDNTQDRSSKPAAGLRPIMSLVRFEDRMKIDFQEDLPNWSRPIAGLFSS